jgi:LmbE family N-acetylglucosaminyl deacetylase
MCLFLFSFFALAASMHAQTSPYFPEKGSRAVAQDVREIRNPSVYLVIAIAPGFEDLASIASFRIGEGASVSVAYVTNGEDIPSDLSGESFYQLASRRKEEAFLALSHLGVQPYFLNIPVQQFPVRDFHPTGELSNRLGELLDSVVSRVQPDIVIIENDPLSGKVESTRLSFLTKLVVDRIQSRVDSTSWSFKRAFVGTGDKMNSVAIPVGRKDQIWSKSYLQMANEAERSYASLRFQIPLWKEGESHRYSQLYPHTRRPIFPLDRDLPKFGVELKTFLPVFNSIYSIQKIKNREMQLSILHDVIAELESFISRHKQSFDRIDLRVLVAWKYTLEKLRCAVLGVTIPFTLSDSVVTRSQLLFLHFGKLDPAFDKGTTQIIFPGVMQKQWIVNESQENYYPWKNGAKLRVLSPQSIPQNSTESPAGFGAMELRTPFTFFVVHRDSNPNHDFMYRHEIPLIVAPIWSMDVLTPQVAMHHDKSIVVRFRCNVPDKAGDVFYVDDPSVSSQKKMVELLGENYALTDTLPLLWNDSVNTIPHSVKILASGNTIIGSFFAQSLDVKSQIKSEIGFCSIIENSPVLNALRRLGLTVAVLDTVKSLDRDLADYSVIIVDRFSLEKFAALPVQHSSIERWISDGGRLIVMPQYGVTVKDTPFDDRIKFTYLPVTGSSENIEVDSTSRIFNGPNRIDMGTFSREPFVASYGEIDKPLDDSAKILAASESRVLLLEKQIGKGEILYCSLNFYPGLLEINRSSYELLANLVSF